MAGLRALVLFIYVIRNTEQIARGVGQQERVTPQTSHISSTMFLLMTRDKEGPVLLRCDEKEED